MRQMRAYYYILFITIMILPLGKMASAQIAEQPCDTQYWRQMTSKAWLEAEREIMQNQNLIFKADSVMEYTCFDQFVRINAWDGGNIFVHTNYFGEQIIPRGTPASMEITYQTAITAALEAYRDQNFNHEFLGGRGEHLGLPNSTITPATEQLTGSGYDCEVMADVWRVSKCLNFIDNPAFELTDGFYPFDAIIGFNSPDVAGYADTIEDTRDWPTECGGDLGVAGSWADQIELAMNVGDTLYDFHTPLGEIYFEVNERVRPGAPCADPILTGVRVVPANGDGDPDDDNNTYFDGVCTNPGCAYVRPGSGDVGACLVGSNAVYGDGANNDFGVGTFNPQTGSGGF